VFPADEKEQPVTVELIMQVSRSKDNRLSGTVRRGKAAEARDFSGTLELMRVFEELVPVESSEQPATTFQSWGER
jgi:hypothetical protein